MDGRGGEKKTEAAEEGERERKTVERSGSRAKIERHLMLRQWGDESPVCTEMLTSPNRKWKKSLNMHLKTHLVKRKKKVCPLSSREMANCK